MIPQKKKSPEEIAKLRESLGLPGSEPVTAPDPGPVVPAPPVQAAPPQPAPEPRPPVEAKPVRSLRKSERIPSPGHTPKPSAAASNLPVQRRSETELNRIRRAQAFENRQPPPATHLLAITANPFLVGLGYLLAAAAALMPFANSRMWFPAPFALTASLAGASILIAAFIFLKKKRSAHNACFIAAIAFFTLVFSALYYFPQLRNAS